jgi:hypothetical protein
MRIISARQILVLWTVALFAEALPAGPADKTRNNAFEQQIRSQYVLAQASHFNRVNSPGTVVVIQQGGLSAAPPASLTGAMAWYVNTFKDGKRQNHGLREFSWQSQGTLRTIEAGERFYVSKLDVKESAITFYLVSCEQIEGSHFYAGVSFQFAKGYQTSLALADVQQAIGQVFTSEVSAPDDQKQNVQRGQPGPPTPGQPDVGQPAEAPASFAPIAPPAPPPQDAPTTAVEIAIGQTPDQVKAALGQPDRIVKAGAKEIYSYKNLKVTFVDGKVSDVE